MLVKLNTSLAGADFSLAFGTEIDSEEFSALVGTGWENLCDPIIEVAVKPVAEEEAVLDPVAETAVKPPVMETTSRRGRQK